MKAFHYTDLQAEQVREGAKGVTLRWLISAKDGAPNFAMRLFEFEPGGYTPQHTHAWEHEVFVLSGEGQVKGAEAATSLKEGSVVCMPPGTLHQFVAGPRGMRMICCIPNPK